jgi:spermidine synthase
MQGYVALRQPFSLKQKFLSYFFEQKIMKKAGLEVVYHKDKLLLNASNVNYSNGSLQYRLHQAFSHFGVYHHKIKSVLVLGFGFGSALHLFQQHRMEIETVLGVEKNQQIIDLAHHWYQYAPNVQILHQDVARFLTSNHSKFDLILIDVFEGDKVPDDMLEKETILDILSRLQEGGCCLMNVLNHVHNPIVNIHDLFDETLDLMGEHIFLFKSNRK